MRDWPQVTPLIRELKHNTNELLQDDIKGAEVEFDVVETLIMIWQEMHQLQQVAPAITGIIANEKNLKYTELALPKSKVAPEELEAAKKAMIIPDAGDTSLAQAITKQTQEMLKGYFKVDDHIHSVWDDKTAVRRYTVVYRNQTAYKLSNPPINTDLVELTGNGMYTITGGLKEKECYLGKLIAYKDLPDQLKEVVKEGIQDIINSKKGE